MDASVRLRCTSCDDLQLGLPDGVRFGLPGTLVFKDSDSGRDYVALLGNVARICPLLDARICRRQTLRRYGPGNRTIADQVREGPCLV